ncbi:hypothetical protein D3C87_1759650 [compost metagenome]
MSRTNSKAMGPSVTWWQRRSGSGSGRLSTLLQSCALPPFAANARNIRFSPADFTCAFPLTVAIVFFMWFEDKNDDSAQEKEGLPKFREGLGKT